MARRNWRGWLFLLLGAVFLSLLIWYFGWRDLLAALQSARPWPLVVMSMLILAGFWIRALKWRYVLGAGHNAVALFFLSKMAGNWSPGRVGELSPLLLRQHRNARVAAWILADRVVEIGMTLVLGLAGVVALGLTPWPAAAALLILGAAAGAGFVWSLCRVRLLVRWAGQAEPGSWKERVLGALAQVQLELTRLGGKSAGVLLLTLAAKVTDIVAVQLLCWAFGYSASFLLVCAARCAHALVAAIPLTPDATGVPYVAAAYLLHEHAHMPGDTLTAALGLEVAVINLLLYLSFLVGAAPLRRAPGMEKGEPAGADPPE